MAENKAAKSALVAYRKDRRVSTRSLARVYGTTVPEIHQVAGCGVNCKGMGCRL
jgi:hypothetical protein